jgi:hypothetical protein
MIFMFTGQPGHGKTLLSLERALAFKAQGRIVYACNVRQLDYEKTGFVKLDLEQFKDWQELPDGAVIWLDEAYMAMPKMNSGSKVPPFIDELARHRHRGFDFIFVCQSPSTQMHSFVHDLIEEHYHVRRRYGMPFVHVRRFDRYERNPEKTEPLTLTRRSYPKKLFGLYKSTELDTTQKRVPWFYYAAIVLALAVVAAGIFAAKRVTNRLTPDSAQQTQAARKDGAPATAVAGGSASKGQSRGTRDDYVSSFIPRIPGQPWSASAYDGLSVPSQAPRVFCMSAGAGIDAQGYTLPATCGCKTEQGNRYFVERDTCETIARNGQHEPFLALVESESNSTNSPQTASIENIVEQPPSVVVEGNLRAVKTREPLMSTF